MANSIPAKQPAIPTDATNIRIFWETFLEREAHVRRPARITAHRSVAMVWLYAVIPPSPRAEKRTCLLCR